MGIEPTSETWEASEQTSRSMRWSHQKISANKSGRNDGFPPTFWLLREFRFRAGIPLRTLLAVSEEHVATNCSVATFTGPDHLCVPTKSL